MNELLPNVMVGGPVRDREWSVPLWLGGLLNLDYPRELLTLALLVNDSRDETLRCCHWWADRARAEGWSRVVLVQQNFGTIADNNDRAGRDFQAFAKARDAWVNLRQGEPWFFQVDSDVQCEADTLRHLVELAQAHELEMLAALLRNHVGCASHHTNVLHEMDNGEGRDFLYHDMHAWEDPPEVAVAPCDVTGACVLLSQTAYDAAGGYRGADTSEVAELGEDTPFCRRLTAAGIRPHYAPHVRVTHWMEPPARLDHQADHDWHLRQALYHLHRANVLERADAIQAG